MYKILTLATFIFAAGYTVEATAFPPIDRTVAPTQNAEAQSISVEFTTRNSGTATIEGCERLCPFTLSIDEETLFFSNGAALKHGEAKSLSGTSGTVLFRDDRAVKILWFK